MGLSDGKVTAAIAVTDMDRAVEFYEGKLGLTPGSGDEPDGGRTYQCGSGTRPANPRVATNPGHGVLARSAL